MHKWNIGAMLGGSQLDNMLLLTTIFHQTHITDNRLCSGARNILSFCIGGSLKALPFSGRIADLFSIGDCSSNQQNVEHEF